MQVDVVCLLPLLFCPDRCYFGLLDGCVTSFNHFSVHFLNLELSDYHNISAPLLSALSELSLYQIITTSV